MANKFNNARHNELREKFLKKRNEFIETSGKKYISENPSEYYMSNEYWGELNLNEKINNYRESIDNNTFNEFPLHSYLKILANTSNNDFNSKRQLIYGTVEDNPVYSFLKEFKESLDKSGLFEKIKERYDITWDDAEESKESSHFDDIFSKAKGRIEGMLRSIETRGHPNKGIWSEWASDTLINEKRYNLLLNGFVNSDESLFSKNMQGLVFNLSQGKVGWSDIKIE